MSQLNYVAGGAYDRFHGGIFPLPQLFKCKSDPVRSGGMSTDPRKQFNRGKYYYPVKVNNFT